MSADSIEISYALFIGLNPSTADQNKDDPTIRKCVGFAKRWGFEAVCMVNLFAIRGSNPSVIMSVEDPMGPENDRWIEQCANSADRIIAAWGIHGRYRGRDKRVTDLLYQKKVEALAINKDGTPMHPLYAAYGVEPVDYPP